MTNAEKYNLTREQTKELCYEIARFCNETVQAGMIMDFFNTPIKPTLTEDERVILRNIKDGIDTIMSVTICRNNGELYIEIPSTQEKIELYMFNHLFQFIKERRGIRDS